MKIKLFDEEIAIKDNYCALDNHSPQKIEKPYVNIYANITDFCNAACAFCCNPNKTVGKYMRNFNFFKFYYILQQLHKSGVKINKVSFTGGEPTLDEILLERCLSATKEIDPNIFTVVSTNGTNLDALQDCIQDVDSIAVSRHHYSDNMNDGILHTGVFSNEQLCNFPHKDKIHLSCNLIKDLIDSEQEIEMFLKFASSVGIFDVGFVSLMKINKYTEARFIDFSSLSFEKIPNMFLSKTWQKEKDCKCKNYLYLDEGRVVRVYMRHQINPRCSEAPLCFDGRDLRLGFNGKIIF